MSELVSANTRNFLFLTVSQYNDQKRLVPARVSMRRDQPFWEGGNSFLACESFRISSSPSQGGLYYGKVPKSWYMQTSIHERTQPTGNAAGDWPQQKQDVAILLQTDVLKARRLYISSTGTVASPAYKANMRLGLDVLDPNVAYTTMLLQRLGRYFNPNRITQGSYLRVQDGGDATKWVEGRVVTAPSQTVTGVGIGEHRLWQAKCDLMGHTADFADALYANNDAILNIKVMFEDTTSSGMDLPARVEEFVSQGMFLEFFEKLAGGYPLNYQGMPVTGGFWKVLCPRNVTLQLAKAMVDGEIDGEVTWDSSVPLAVDSLVTFMKTGETTPHITKCTQVGTWLKSYSATRCEADIRLTTTATARTWLNGKNNAIIKNALQHFMQPTTTEIPSNVSVGADVEIQITATSEGVGSAPPVFTNSYTDVVRLGNGTRPDKLVIRRQPTTADDFYVYTPNQLFYTFNQPDASFLHLPWQLQTDENGGFMVVWGAAFDDPNKLNYFDFVISKAMCDSLGLNNYITAEVTRPTNNIDVGDEKASDNATETHYEVVVQRVTDVSETAVRFQKQNFSERIHTVDARQLRNIDGTAYIPISPVTPEAFGTNVHLPTGPDTYALCQVLSCEVVHSVVKKSEFVKYYPIVEQDEYGETRYRYQNLPASSKLGNTQQVSVESWSTYSQIDLVIPNLPFQPMLGSATDARILCSLRLPFVNETGNSGTGQVQSTSFEYYGDLLFNSDSSRSYLRITTDQQLYDVDVECRLIRRDGSMDILKLPYKGQFQVKLRFLQTQ